MAALKRLAAGDTRKAMDDIGEYMVSTTKDRFSAGQAPDNTPWEANTEATLKAFARRKRGSTVRRKGERVKAAGLSGKRVLIGESQRLATEIHYRATSGSVEIGSSLEYSAVQQFGAKRGAFGATKRGAPIPWNDIPARPYLGLSDRDRDEVVLILQEHVLAALKG